MEIWQVVAMIVFVALPVTLLFDLHPHRERLTARGRPLPRSWERADHPDAVHPDPDAAHGEHDTDAPAGHR